MKHWLALACLLIACGDGPLGAGGPCAEVKDLATCKQHPDCHPVFQDPGTCRCAQVGCCQMFQGCAAGDKADCKGPALCRAAAPNCDGDYTVAFANSCYEGCALKTDCAP